MNRRTFLWSTGTAAVACVGYAIGIEPHWLEIVERDLPIEKLPSSLDGLRLAQLSDIHIGPRVSDGYVVDSFDRLRARKPDIVVFTGDFITFRASRGEAQFAQLRDVVSHVPRGSLATLGILGNHDYGRNWSEPNVAAKVVAEAERAGMQVLRNECVSVRGLDVVGVDDLWAHRGDPALALAARTSNAALVLVHNPDAADELRWPDYRGWMLAGHTHGGQCNRRFSRHPCFPCGIDAMCRARSPSTLAARCTSAAVSDT